MCNADIRAEAKSSGVFLWEIAEAMGISEPTMTRKLRRELPNSDKKPFFDIIKKISDAKKENASC